MDHPRRRDGDVKNAKNSDHHWVSACVTPIYDQGVYGCWLRNKPTLEQIQRAEALLPPLRRQAGDPRRTAASLLNGLPFIPTCSIGFPSVSGRTSGFHPRRPACCSVAGSPTVPRVKCG